MALDLKIIPQYDVSAEMGLSLLDLHQEQAYFERVKALLKEKGREVSVSGFNSFAGNSNGESYGNTVEDAYGTRMQEVQAKDFKFVFKSFKSKFWQNRASLQYIKAMPDDLKLWFYWH